MGFAASEVARRKRDKIRRTDSLLVRVCRRDCSYLDEWGTEDGIFDRMAADDADWEGWAGNGKGGRGGWKFRQAEIIRDGTEVEGRPTGDMENIMALCHGPRPPTALAWLRVGGILGSVGR